MPEEEDVLWKGLVDLSQALTEAQSTLDAAEKQIAAYENELSEVAQESREEIARWRSQIDPIAATALGHVAEAPDKRKAASGFRKDLGLLELVTKAASALTPYAIGEIASSLHAKTKVEAINPIFVEEGNLRKLNELDIEHNNHLESRDWLSPAWTEKEERFARSFKALLMSMAGNRRRGILRTFFGPAVAVAALAISILSQLALAVENLPLLVFVLIGIAAIFYLLPPAAKGFKSGLQLDRWKTIAALVATLLVPLVLALAVIPTSLFPLGTPLNRFIAAWPLFGAVAIYAFNGYVGPFEEALQGLTREALLSKLDLTEALY